MARANKDENLSLSSRKVMLQGHYDIGMEALERDNIVWAKLDDNLYWPGKIKPRAHILKDKSVHVLVFIFGKNKSLWLSKNKVMPYMKYKNLFERVNAMTKSFRLVFKDESDHVDACRAMEDYIKKNGTSEEYFSFPTYFTSNEQAYLACSQPVLTERLTATSDVTMEKFKVRKCSVVLEDVCKRNICKKNTKRLKLKMCSVVLEDIANTFLKDQSKQNTLPRTTVNVSSDSLINIVNNRLNENSSDSVTSALISGRICNEKTPTTVEKPSTNQQHGCYRLRECSVILKDIKDHLPVPDKVKPKDDLGLRVRTLKLKRKEEGLYPINKQDLRFKKVRTEGIAPINRQIIYGNYVSLKRTSIRKIEELTSIKKQNVLDSMKNKFNIGEHPIIFDNFLEKKPQKIFRGSRSAQPLFVVPHKKSQPKKKSRPKSTLSMVDDEFLKKMEPDISLEEPESNGVLFNNKYLVQKPHYFSDSDSSTPIKNADDKQENIVKDTPISNSSIKKRLKMEETETETEMMSIGIDLDQSEDPLDIDAISISDDPLQTEAIDRREDPLHTDVIYISDDPLQTDAIDRNEDSLHTDVIDRSEDFICTNEMKEVKCFSPSLTVKDRVLQSCQPKIVVNGFSQIQVNEETETEINDLDIKSFIVKEEPFIIETEEEEMEKEEEEVASQLPSRPLSKNNNSSSLQQHNPVMDLLSVMRMRFGGNKPISPRKGK